MRIRKSIEELQIAYEHGDKKPLETLMRAWKGIEDLAPDDVNSYFLIAGYHGEPFRGAGWGNSGFWGGYCNHGNVLFPTWHRLYLYRLENALRSIAGCEEVAIPFWDETSIASTNNGVPWALTLETFELDGKAIANPLRSFSLSRQIKDHIGGDNPDYSKPLGYETVRYPLSGLMGSQDIEKTTAHNAQYPNYSYNVGLLNANIINWLTSYIEIGDGANRRRIATNVVHKYTECLAAPNYTVFSNTTSAAEWNGNLATGGMPVVPLESPHNSIHLAVGGYDVPAGPNAGGSSQIAFANGDMGENDTASFDPIFFFHHCFVDRVFWLWQQRHRATDALDIIERYPGTNSVDNQGPTPGIAANSWLTLDSPLDPFRKPDDSPYTSRDCINIEKQLGYTYGRGSLEDPAVPATAMAREATSAMRHVFVSGINRGAIRGSFLISVFATIDGKRHRIGTEAVLSRWHVEGCVNCQAHLQASAAIPLYGLATAVTDKPEISVEVLTRDGPLTQHASASAQTLPPSRPRFRFSVR
jgi:tyrosinase